MTDAPARTAPVLGDLRSWQQWVKLALRLYIGIMLLAAGITKVVNMDLFAHNIIYYHLVSYEVGNVIGHTLPILEIVVGALLTVGAFTRVTAAISALFMGVFIFSISWVWYHGYLIDCGCFGTGGQDANAASSYPWEILRDAVAFVGAVWLAIRPRSIAAVDNWLFPPLPTFHDLDDADSVPATSARPAHL